MSIEQTIVDQQMGNPSSSLGSYELPCGWIDPDGQLVTAVDITEMTGNEEDMLASTKIPPYKKVSQLLTGCVSRIGDVTSKGQLTTVMDELTNGDRMYLMFAIRRTTLGDELPVRETCPECSDRSLYVLDLSELKIKKMPDPMKRVFDLTLPSGKAVRFRVSTGADEARIAKVSRPGRTDKLSQALLMRLELLEGEPPSLQSVKNMGLKDRLTLRDAFQKEEGGIDTAMDLECPACGHEWEEDIDMGNRSFFFPSETQKP